MKKKSGGFLAVFWRGLSGQFFLISILPLTILLLVVAFASQTLHHNAMRTLVGDRDVRVARAASNALNQELASRVTVLSLLSANEGANLNNGGDEMTTLFDHGLAGISADGQVTTSTQPKWDWQKAAEMLSGNHDASPVILTLDSNQAVIAVPRAQGGWILGGFDPQLFIGRLLAAFVDSNQTSIRIISKDPAQSQGYSLVFSAGPNLSTDPLQAQTGFEQALAGQSGMTYLPGAQGELVVAYAPVPLAGWALIADEEWESITSPLLRSTQLAPLVLAPALLLAILALWYAARQIIQPLRKLEKQTGALSRGDFGAIHDSVGGIPEIQNLQMSLAEMSDKLSAAQHSLHGYIGAVTAGIENERRNLARELHDDTIQSLIALNQRLQLAAQKETNPEKKAQLAELQAMLQQAMVNLRWLVRGLRPVYLEDLGLSTALEMLVQETRQQNKLEITFLRTGREVRLDAAREVMLFRIAQEALNNIVRHAAANQASVHLVYLQDQLQLTIQDDGKGFALPDDLNCFASQNHFGLVGLYERAEGINASLAVQTAPGKGTVIQVNLPIPPST